MEELSPGKLAVLNHADRIHVSDEPLLSVLSITLQSESGELRLRHDVDLSSVTYLLGKKKGWVFRR